MGNDSPTDIYDQLAKQNRNKKSLQGITVTINNPFLVIDILADNPEIKSSLVTNVSREDYESYLIEALKEKLKRDGYLT